MTVNDDHSLSISSASWKDLSGEISPIRSYKEALVGSSNNKKLSISWDEFTTQDDQNSGPSSASLHNNAEQNHQIDKGQANEAPLTTIKINERTRWDDEEKNELIRCNILQ